MNTYLDSCYSFQLKPTDGKNKYTVEKRSIKGKNYPYLNSFFAFKEIVTFRKLEPIGLDRGVILFPLTYGDKENEQTLALETSLMAYPYGVIQVPNSKDCMLFIISGDYNIEIFVSLGNSNMTAQLLHLLSDGSLHREIDNLQ